MSARPPIAIEMVRYAELSVGIDDRTILNQPDSIVLTIGYPADAGVATCIYEIPLPVAGAVDLIERLVAMVGKVKGRRDPTMPDGAGPRSSRI